MDIVNNYANKHKVQVNKVFAADGTYGVETIIHAAYSNDGTEQSSTEWFTTQEQQQHEYITVIGEISRGEWV